MFDSSKEGTGVKYIVGKEDDGLSLKLILSQKLGLSRAFIKHLKFLDGGIELNGKSATVRAIAHEGDELFLALEDEGIPDHLTPTDIPLDIIYEDDHIILPNKPPFMPTHPSHLHHGDTLADALAYRYARDGKPFVFRPVNRLDRNTSGISLIAKHRISASFLFFARQKDMIKKKYIALLCGNIGGDGQWNTVETYMKRQEDSIIVRCVSSEDEEGSFIAVTRWKLLFSNEQISIVEAEPITGRTHQLRVHFAHLGHPIIGDDVYGQADDSIGRHALHAALLSLPLPYSEERRDFISHTPADMIDIAQKYGCNLKKVFEDSFNK